MTELLFTTSYLRTTAAPIVNVLGVVYAHVKTSNGGDLYLTEHGLPYSDLLQIENWHETRWFKAHRERLTGTSAVYRVPTREIDGRRLQLVVKTNRVGEDIPMDTRTMMEFVNAEFNSPWEEFALVSELREGEFGPRYIAVKTQRPLAIYVPPERLQLWQTGRSQSRIRKITQRHPGIDLDILRQYKLVYQWIEGLNLVEALTDIGLEGDGLKEHLLPLTQKAIADLAAKGFAVADMKPEHIIIGEEDIEELLTTTGQARCDLVCDLVERGQYAIVDYELMLRTPEHEGEVKSSRRRTYLSDQRDRFTETPLPLHLVGSEIMGVPYVHGRAESTGGRLWVVGRNPRLFDYFLPERWRRTPCRALSQQHEVYYTVTKDNIHIVWKTSRVGDGPDPGEAGENEGLIRERGFNSPFEESAIALYLSNRGVPTIYVRAVYQTGSARLDPVVDPSRFQSHRGLLGLDGTPILREDHNYITIRGFYNGPDAYVASHDGSLYRAFDLERACREGILHYNECLKLVEVTRSRLRNVGYDGTLMEVNDILVTLDPAGEIVRDAEGLPEARICNLELIHPL
ncbi:MAG: hypothetical protein FJZ90_01015 [Chloroflexi bacterium]|nr:hypothetical protein [Chloroflexota bacterium]